MPPPLKQQWTSTKYQWDKVTCFCKQCSDRSSGEGLRIPKYTARRHAMQFPLRDTTLSRHFDTRYAVQPFEKPQVTPDVAESSSALESISAGELSRLLLPESSQSGNIWQNGDHNDLQSQNDTLFREVYTDDVAVTDIDDIESQNEGSLLQVAT